MRKFLISTILLAVLAVSARTWAGEIGFVEQFSLADDRAEPLKQLIPGTEDYYYYHCLHYQNTGQLDKVPEVLEAWIKRYRFTPRVEEIRNRQALLTYGQDPQATLNLIKQRLNLRFDHQKQDLNAKPDLPRALDQNLISRETLTGVALGRYPNTLQGFEDSALEFLAKGQLEGDRLRDFLRRLQRPDYPDMAKRVVEDLRNPHSGGFGSIPIHAKLLLAQLDECLALKPDLLQDSNFVNAYLTKLQPNADVDWQHDDKEKVAFLGRLWAFASRLPPAQNSLKACILYQRLTFDVARDVYDKARFLEYLKLPRPVFYINPRYLDRPENRGCAVNLNADYRPQTSLPPIGLDEPLVRRCLMRFLLDAPNYDDFADYIETNYLKELFAETKILAGKGDMEQWYSLLPPEKVRDLKERVDLELLPTNPEVVGANDPVRLDVAVKNVPTLLVRTYIINAFNYYRDKNEEITTAVDLDGLTANSEKTLKYTQVPLRRHVEKLEFPDIAKPGVYVVELIGNGQSSRALIRKGRLTFMQRTGSAGHVFTVYDEQNNVVTNAALWLAGHEYKPDDAGEIAVPFSNSPGSQKIILVYEGLARLCTFDHQAERYSFSAGIHADHESLLDGRMCKVLVRPELSLNGRPVDIGLLEEVSLTLQTTDQDGIQSSKVVNDFKLQNDRESVYEFRVPDKLAQMAFVLSGKVQSLSQNKKLDLAAREAVTVNGIDKTDKTEMLLLRHAGGRFWIELLGKTGEPRPDRPVQVEIKHRDFKDKVNASLQTDEAGRTDLGELQDIEVVTAKGPEGAAQTWGLPRDRHSYPDAIHAAAGEPVAVPLMEPAPQDKRDAFSLLEVRDSTFVRDCADSATLRDGFVVLDDLAPGDYDLVLKDVPRTIRLRITQGKRLGERLLGQSRTLDSRGLQPLQIGAVEVAAGTNAADQIRVHLKNASKLARVHIVATRFAPGVSLFQSIGGPMWPDPQAVEFTPPESVYLSGRDIGDEYRYVLERRQATIFPGNMLKRPSLILNPWSLRKTEAGREDLEAGEEWDAARSPVVMRGIYGSRAAGARGAVEAQQGFVKLDFLPEPALVLANLRPDKDRIVTIDRAALGPRQQVHIFAVDQASAAYREIALPLVDEKCRDLRLTRPLDPQRHFAEQKKVTDVAAGAPFVLEDVASSKMEAYDSLATVYRLFSTLNGSPTLTEFGFILDWPTLKPEKQRELYSKYACHELNSFLFHKDPDFFKAAILPYLRNKKDKTFMDHWLIGGDLSGYLKPWEYGRLNIVECILLARRIKDQAASTRRHVKDLNDLIPPDVEAFNRLFDTALKGSALETGDRFGLREAAGRAAGEKEVPMEAPAAAAAPGARAFQMAAQVTAEDGRKASRRGKRTADQLERQEDMRAMAEAEPAAEEMVMADEAVGYMEAADKDALRRLQARQFFRKLDMTEEWVENNYYQLPIEQQMASLVTVNGFWNDYAAHDGQGPFLSTHVAEASRSFAEQMLALAVLDLPFKPGEHKTEIKEARLTLTAASPAIVFHKEITETAAAEDPQPILVGQNFFAYDDRYRYEDNEKFDKFVTAEFRTARVYGCQVVLTNPTSGRRKVDALLQIPAGAIPVLNGLQTRSLHRQLEPYSTQTIEYYFYFPAPGRFVHYPVHVAQDGKFLAATEPFVFNVVTELTQIDKTSWPYISQNGAAGEVLRYLQDNNIDRLDLDLIAFRMRDADFFVKTLALLRRRHVYQGTLWSYGVFHNAAPVIHEYLPHTPFANQCGPSIASELLTLDPVARYVYQHKEYWPLVNARAHQVGKRRKILNESFFQQYEQFMTCLAYRPKLDDGDLMGVVICLLLQDRVEEALKFFDRIQPQRLASALQYEYLKAYLLLSREKPREAREVAAKYRDYPVDRWRNLFANVLAQTEEIEGQAAKVVDKEDRDQAQAQLADTSPALDFKVENRQITLEYQNLESCRINYYPMDIELLFSRNPFAQDVSGQFSVIQPAESAVVNLPKGKNVLTVDLPKAYHDRNVMIEAVGDGLTRSHAYYPNSLNVQVIENYGQVRVLHEGTRKPLAKVYVKVYVRMKGGAVQFYKDGYTDLRGRFDYASLNTNEIEGAEKFSILIMSDQHGSVVREAAPPKM